MLKTKQPIPRNMILWGGVAFLVIAGIIVLSLSFNRGSQQSAEEEVSAIYTNAAITLTSQAMTSQASTPSATSTLAVTPTATATISLATPTLAISSPLPTSTTSVTTGGCDNSVYVADVTIPDNTAVTPGQSITKTWRVQNTGTCTWSTAYKIIFAYGDAMGGQATALSASVAPGATIDVSVVMTAPTKAGKAEGTWRLANDKGQPFGTVLTIVINVSGNAVTGTATLTVTPGPSPTPGTPTITPTGTSSIPLPNPANNPDITLSCTLGGTGGTQYEYAGKLTWEDMSTNENGFNIYINGTLVAIAPADTTSYKVASVFYDAGTPVTYSIEAFNAGGKAAQANVTKQCP
jgi:hypothetical protein